MSFDSRCSDSRHTHSEQHSPTMLAQKLNRARPAVAAAAADDEQAPQAKRQHAAAADMHAQSAQVRSDSTHSAHVGENRGMKM